MVTKLLNPPKHVAEDFYIGKTHIIISDDYCGDKTPEDAELILCDVARYALKVFRANPLSVDWREG
ncbi:MAG: hypothetical protein LBS62_07010 [Clostridiales bacterium]|jgi:hypothetical protein|nr:hypothetical protein [Clostridiales bacterium]